MKRGRSPSTRTLQFGFLILLLVCAAQLAFWMFDEVNYTRAVTERLRTHYASDTVAARALLDRQASAAEVVGLYPHLDVSNDGRIGISASVLERLDRDRFHRLNRYFWEGAFFLAVLLAAMAVVYKALREEAELRRRQEQFLAAVSHEFKSPLASLRLSIETLSLRDPGPAERAELIRRVLVELSRLERMIHNTLDTSRLASGGSAVPEHVHIADVVDEMLRELQGFAEECGVRVEADVPLALAVHADREGVGTVLRNLVHNAIKASPREGVVQVRAQAEANEVILTVEDRGIGFPPSEAARLFEQFYRVEGDGRGRMQGTGLGLYLVERLVAHAGGRVTAESAGAGHGATFTVRWPASSEGA